IREEILSSVVTEGKPLSILFETKGKDGWLGHTDSFIEVCVPSEENLSGEIAEVVPIATENGILYGQLK
ncbi:MAG: hypothetical protein IJ012_07860, partial [Clostridia bacterium]|nr:hypothetical protein [Clostridia bacterium]